MPIARYFCPACASAYTLLFSSIFLVAPLAASASSRSSSSWPAEPGFCLYVSVGALGGTLFYDYFR